MIRLIIKTFADRERGVFSELALARSRVVKQSCLYNNNMLVTSREVCFEKKIMVM